MIKASLLIFAPGLTWDRIARAQRGPGFVLAIYLVPLLALGSVAQAFRLVHWGVLQGEVAHRRPFAVGETVVFEATQFLLSLLVVFVGAWLVKSLGETFHGRHNYAQTFTAVAYSLGPLFLFRLLDAVKDFSPWLSWGIGFLLCVRVLYHGVPRVMQPDPPHAFGLFVMSTFLLLLTTGLAELVTACYLQGKFAKLEAIISGLAAQLPF
jgi:hypothetical protein